MHGKVGVVCLMVVCPVAWCEAPAAADASLQRAIGIAMHEVTATGDSYQFDNRENRLHGEFTVAGVQVSNSSGSVRFELAAYGHGDRLVRPGAAVVSGAGNRVEYRRGGLTEWYVNEGRGLEQGFTMHSPPEGTGSGLLTLELSVTGDFETRLEGGAILFTRDERPVIRYSGLQAWDATGRQLPARMEADGQRIRLLVTTVDAAYPVTIDPWLQQAMLVASDPAAGDNLGYAVSVSGDTAVLGSFGKNNNQGAAYVFVRNGSSWTQQQKLTANDGLPGDQFGFSVSLSGDTAIVGAPGYPAGQGAAYVFVRSGALWTQQAKLTAAGEAQPNDVFGFSVSLSGDTALVGAYGRSSYQGVAYVFLRSGVTWTQQQKLVAADGAANDFFGYSVAVSGDTALLGAHGKSLSGGTVYVFVRTSGAWIQLQKLPAPPKLLAGESFGKRVSLSGDTAVIGIPGQAASQGGACVYVRTAGSWILQSALTAADLQAGDNFGFSVAVEGDTALVGAYGQASFRGAAYMFVRNGLNWVLQQKITAAGGQPGDALGISVSVSGDTALIGAYGRTIYQGAAYVFLSDGSLWAEQQIVSAASDGAPSDGFGYAVAISGNTAVVGAYGKMTNQGAAYVFLRTGSTWSLQQKLLASDGTPNDLFGISVAISGNIAVVGASGKASYQGAAYVFVRSGTNWSQYQKLTASDGAVSDHFGSSVGVSGLTAVVGASYKSGRGAAYVFVKGHLPLWSEQQILTASDGASSDSFGSSVSVSVDTALVGAPDQASGRGAA